MNRGYTFPIVINDHDVLSGRGVNIAHHPGNQRFRTLVTTRADENYCTHYSASEKRAVAEEIIKHIHSLDPPGRFLRKDARRGNGRGLNGPWIELSEREAVKKTCQALRDCNRTDRQGYASGVEIPEDVLKEANQRAQLGLSGKQQAAAAAAAAAAAQPPPEQEVTFKRPWGRVSPSVENAAEWLKKQRTDEAMATAAAAAISDFPSATTSDFGSLKQTQQQQQRTTSDDAMATAAAAAAASAVNDYTPVHDETALAAANAVYTPNDLLAQAEHTEEDDDDAAIAEAAEVVASITESDDAISPGQHHHYQYPTLSASEEALAREMAAAGGLMSSSAGLNMNTSGGGLSLNEHEGLNMNEL